MSIDWGKIVQGGFEIVKEAITGPRLSGPPVPPASQSSSAPQGNTTTILLIVAGLVLVFGKSLKKIFK